MTNPYIPKIVSTVNGTDDCVACPKYWIALYTRPRSEKKVRAYLDSKGIETYLPIQKPLRQWSDRKKLIAVVVIPMIVFANIEKTQFRQIANYSLILKLLTQPGSKSVAMILIDQIEKLKFILGQSDYPISFDPASFQVNDQVRVARGPLKGLIGDVFSIDHEFLEIAVSLGIKGVARLKIEKINIEPL